MAYWQTEMLLIARSLGWALLHSLWQAILLLGILKLVFRLMPNIAARSKYNLSLAVLTGAFVWFAETWLTNWYRFKNVQAYIEQNGVNSTHLAYRNLYVQGIPTSLQTQLEKWFPIIAVLYTTGLLFLSAKFIYQYSRLRIYRTKGVIMPGADWLDKLNAFQLQMGITAKTKLLFSEYVKVPMVSGFLKPLILVPVATVTQLTVEQLEAILIHELAHIKRQDYIINMLQIVMETILFFNPAVWILSKMIRNEREHCCDDIVLQQTEQPLSYARALAALETLKQNPLAMAATNKKQILFTRIKRIMEMKRNTSHSPALIGLVIVCLLASLVWLTPVIAQTIKEKKKTPVTAAKKKTNTPHGTRISLNTGNAKHLPVPPTPISPIEPPEPLAPLEPAAPLAPLEPLEQLTALQGNTSMTETQLERVEEALDNIYDAMDDAEDAKEDGADKEEWKEIKQELEEARKEMAHALKGVDWAQIDKDMRKARKESDKAMSSVNWDKVNAEVHNAQREAARAMESVDWDAIKKEVEQAHKEGAKARKEGMKAREEAMGSRKLAMQARKEALKDARESIKNARKEARRARAAADDYEPMLAKMETDGLIDSRKGYKITKEDGKLYINGQLQNATVYKKYNSYFKGNEVCINRSSNEKFVKTEN